MNMLGLAQDNITMWWIALGMGCVVVLVVILLLSLLLAFVNDIAKGVRAALNAAGGIAQNTSQVPELGQTAELAGVLRDELGRHAQTLASLRG